MVPPFFARMACFAAALAGVGRAHPPPAADPGDARGGRTLLQVEPPQTSAQRLRWWTDARFGMFIHWGLYSEWGCHFPGPDGKLLDGGSEHMMQRLRIPLATYARIADVFDPTRFDADTWVRIAKDAGMKYLVFTAKHHDGFAMFDSPSSGYDIVSRTPFRRDPVKELAAACRRQGLKFGVYYSLGRDWQDPDVPTRNGYRSNTWDYPDEKAKVFARYFERKVKPQIRELLTQYGPIAVLWFDTPEEISPAESRDLLRLVRSLQPACIVNQRIGNRLGDYRVAEQRIPARGFSDPWETCLTMNRHWGYYLGDNDWKSPRVLVRSLIDIASKGGNFLLNVGPTGLGEIPAPAVERLRAVGRWLAANGPAIYGTGASPLGPLPWGRCTQKVAADGTMLLYLHVFDWPSDGRLIVPGLRAEVASAALLAGNRPLAFASRDGSLELRVPAAAPDPISTTIVLRLAEPLSAR